MGQVTELFHRKKKQKQNVKKDSFSIQKEKSYANSLDSVRFY